LNDTNELKNKMWWVFQNRNHSCHVLYRPILIISIVMIDLVHIYDRLSWGNSWMSKHCDWKNVLLKASNLTINSPLMSCFKLFAEPTYHQNFTLPRESNKYFDVLKSPCNPYFQLIVHHHQAADKIIEHRFQVRFRVNLWIAVVYVMRCLECL
jgi:hypothetical protein